MRLWCNRACYDQGTHENSNKMDLTKLWSWFIEPEVIRITCCDRNTLTNRWKRLLRRCYLTYYNSPPQRRGPESRHEWINKLFYKAGSTYSDYSQLSRKRPSLVRDKVVAHRKNARLFVTSFPSRRCWLDFQSVPDRPASSKPSWKCMTDVESHPVARSA